MPEPPAGTEHEEEVPLHETEVYKPFVAAVAGGEGLHKQFTPRDVRMYERCSRGSSTTGT